MSRSLEDRILVLAPTGRDADMTSAALAGAGFRALPCASMAAACAAIDESAGALLVAEEALKGPAFDTLAGVLERQEQWSDLPIVLLAGAAFNESSDRTGRLLGPLRNVMVLERPVRIGVLVTAMRVALRARKRQYDLRQDLSRREQDAVERARMLESAQKARRDAEAANRLKDEFLATVSHELRTPVNVILGWSGMLARNAMGETVMGAKQGQHAIEVIHRNAHAQAHVIEELLDVSRIITGKLRMDRAAVDLVPLLQDAIDAVQPAIEAKGLTIDSTWSTSVPPIWGDADRLRQVLWNLLANAVKFTPEGGHISVRSARTDGHVEIQVADNGIGIPPETLPYVFDRFRQVDSSTTRTHGGLGLGLAIVKQLVEMHGGRVRAESSGPGGGTQFIVRLPFGRRSTGAGPASAAPMLSPLDARGPLPRLDGVRILVVDDDAGREMIAELLQAQGATVLSTASGAEALAVVGGFRPDVMLTDIAMPGLDGYELQRRLRETMPTDDLPAAIALTANARVDDKARALAHGFAAHVAKPVDAMQLVRTIRQVLPAAA
jgi:signal transduction histidine kinase